LTTESTEYTDHHGNNNTKNIDDRPLMVVCQLKRSVSFSVLCDFRVIQ